MWLLVVPLLVPLAMVGLAALSSGFQRALAGVLAVLAVFNVVMVSGFAPGLADVRTVGVGSLGPLAVTDGRQFVQLLWRQDFTAGPGQLPGSFRRLPGLQRSVTAWLLRYGAAQGQPPVVFAAGGEGHFLNINDLALADRLLERRGLLITGRVDVPAAASLRRYCPWLDDPRRGLPNFVTIHRDTNLSTKRPGRPSPAETRVEAFGFRLIRVVPLPDGPTFIYWRSQGAVPKRCPR